MMMMMSVSHVHDGSYNMMMVLYFTSFLYFMYFAFIFNVTIVLYLIYHG